MLRNSLLVAVVVFLFASAVAAQSSADINVNGSVTPDKIKKGRLTRVSVVMDIP